MTVSDPDLCPRFSVRVFTDVVVGPSPLWLKARLAAIGQRSINNVVDVTNYVMMVLGQPMHAYDLDRVAGPAIDVRRARHGERVVTLDGEERVLEADAVLVCDANGPTGIGGIMGGAASEVSDATHARRDGGGDLERAQHHGDLVEARASHRGELAVRAAAPSRAGARRRSSSPRG